MLHCYELIKSSLSKSLAGSVLDDGQEDMYLLIRRWIIEESHIKLTKSQKILNVELLGVLKECLCSNDTSKLQLFLDKNKNNSDLKMVLNLQRGESESTLLHVLPRSEMWLRVGDVQCSFVEYFHCDLMELLLQAGADPNVQDVKGNTVLHYNYYDHSITNLLITKYGAKYDIKNKLGETLVYDEREERFGIIREDLSNGGDCQQNHEFVLQRSLRDASRQLSLIDEFLREIPKAKNITELLDITDNAIAHGIQLNLHSHLGSVSNLIEGRIGELDGDSETASKIICKLVSHGAMLIGVVSSLEKAEGYDNHMVNMIKAYDERVSSINKFLQAAKGATFNGTLLDAKVDNTNFHLEYSRDSIVNVAEITEKARKLGLKHGSIENGQSIVKIGESEVEIKTHDGKRDYVNLSCGGDVVVTFYVGDIDLDIRLHTDKGSRVNVEVLNPEKLKSCKEEIGEGCLLGGLRVIDAINQGYYEKPHIPEVIKSNSTQDYSVSKVEDWNNGWDDEEISSSVSIDSKPCSNLTEVHVATQELPIMAK